MISIRELNKDELLHIAELRWQFQTEQLEQLGNKQEFLVACVNQLKSPEMANYVHFGALLGDNIIAIASLCVINMVPRPHKVIDQFGYLTNVYMIPQYRSQGIGSQLIKFIHDYAVTQDLELLLVWPSDESIEFYKSLGYCMEGQPLMKKLREY